MTRDKRAHRTFGDVFGRFTRADFSSWLALKSSPLLGWISFAAIAMVITFLMTFSISHIPEEIVAGSIAKHDIRADKNYEIVDETATKKFVDEAVVTVLDVYDYEPELGKRIALRVSEAFEDMRKKTVNGEDVGASKSAFEASVGIGVLTDAAWNELIAQNFSKQFESAINSQVMVAMGRLIATDTGPLVEEKARGIALRDPSGDERIMSSREIGNVLSVDDVKKRMRSAAASKKVLPLVMQLASELIQPNIAFNIAETEVRKKAASEAVKSVVIKVEQGEILIRAGSRYEPRHVIILEGVRREKEKSSTPFKVFGTLVLVALVMLSAFYFAERYIRKFAPQKVDLYFMGIVLVFILVVLRLSLGLIRAIYEPIGFDIPMTAFYYAIPVGGAAMLVRFILNSETALIFSIVASIFSGVFVGHSLNYTAYCLISSIAAATSIAYADKRSSIIRAGIYTAAINILAAVSIQLVNANSLAEPLTVPNVIAYIIFAIIGGISCSVIVTLVTPLAEHLFDYTTDIKLLELANLNHPLLRELVIRAPGTYHHSHLVGILAESASEAIGANPLFARVAAYYHDIGKIRKPLYFVENTTDCESRHEKLSPHMSALIISSHVKEGADLALQYKIPKKIVGVIEQHHGTKMISFFFERAKQQNDPLVQKLDEKDFRYAGPKPQTREAGILLLADAVEAAVRSLKEKGPSRIQQTVEEVINVSFTEAQLDECDLTLRNLHDIAGAFTKILMGIYHQRIEYPKEMFQNGNSEEVIKNA